MISLVYFSKNSFKVELVSFQIGMSVLKMAVHKSWLKIANLSNRWTAVFRPAGRLQHPITATSTDSALEVSLLRHVTVSVFLSNTTMYIFYVLLVVGACGSTTVVDARRRRYRDCHEEPVASREEKANAVVTGTVDRIFITSKGSSCDVKIKRVLKGEGLKTGSSVLVDGIDNEEFCDSHVKEGDTKIFLLTRLSHNLFRLNSSLIQVNVPNLEKINAAIKDDPYLPRPPILDEPCEKKYCPHNGDCRFDKRIVVASCHCPESCTYGGHTPVCGSDGQTYRSLCTFRIDTCKRKKNVYLRHEGACQLTRRSY